MLAVVLIAGLAIAIPALTGQQPLALALSPDVLASIHFEGISPALQESLERGELPVEISAEVEKRILQAVPDGSQIGYVIKVNGMYHAMVMIEKGPEYVRLAEVMLKGEEVEVVEFVPIPAGRLFEGAHVEMAAVGAIYAGGVGDELGEILIDIPPEMEERILQEVPGVIRIIVAGTLDDTYRALVRIDENGQPRHVMVIVHGDEVEIADLDRLRLMGERVIEWELRRDVLSVTLLEAATGHHIWMPQEVQERILQEVGGEIIFATTINHIHHAMVRIEGNGECKYVHVIVEGDKLEIGVARVEWVEYIERPR